MEQFATYRHEYLEFLTGIISDFTLNLSYGEAPCTRWAEIELVLVCKDSCDYFKGRSCRFQSIVKRGLVTHFFTICKPDVVYAAG